MLDLTQKNWSQQIKECNDADTLEDELISIIEQVCSLESQEEAGRLSSTGKAKLKIVRAQERAINIKLKRYYDA